MKNLFIVVLLICITVLSCAKKGTPSGGKKDLDPPVMVKAIPDNYNTNFDGKEITIYFNEFIKLKELDKQLIISPPLKIRPVITPQGGASKYVKIKIYDTLQPNTTYSFNFGKSIVDNNEENPYAFFRYVFSTGASIDSLQLKGTIKDALQKKPDPYVSVLLYEVDSTYTDSIVYKETPKYITSTTDSSTSYQFENLKSGKYLLIALKEENDNYKFNQKTDKIGFIKEHITLPTDKEYDLKIFKEIQDYKSKKPKQVTKNKIKFRYEGPYHEDIKIKLLTEALPEGFKSTITKEVDNDSLQYWYKPVLDLDSLNFTMSYKKQIDSFKVRLRKKSKVDSLEFKSITNTISFNSDFKIQSTTPITEIDPNKIEILNRDSVAVPFTVEHDKLINIISLKFKKEEAQRYYIKAFPEAFKDFLDYKNDTLSFRASTKEYSAYGNTTVTINNIPKTPIIVQLVDDKGEIKYEQFGAGVSKFDFLNIDPADYNLRVVFDTNGNQKYDPGSFLEQQQPERVSYHPGIIEVHANWDVVETFTLK